MTNLITTRSSIRYYMRTVNVSLECAVSHMRRILTAPAYDGMRLYDRRLQLEHEARHGSNYVARWNRG